MNGLKGLPSFKKRQPVAEAPLPSLPPLAETKEQESADNNDRPKKTQVSFSTRTAVKPGEWWTKDDAVTSKMRQACSRDSWPPEQAGSWVNCSVTNQIKDVAVRRVPEKLSLLSRTRPQFLQVSFFPWPELFPAMRGVFATREQAKIRLYRLEADKRITQIAVLTDSTANNPNPPLPKRPEQEYFLSIAWTYSWWHNSSTAAADAQASKWGIPILLVAGDRGVVHVLSGYTLESLQVLVGHGGPITSISVSPQYPWLISTASHDRALRIWNLMLPDQPCVGIMAGIGGHTKEVLATCWHPTRDLVASAGVDRRIKVWPVPPEILERGLGSVVPPPDSDAATPAASTSASQKPIKSRRAHQVHNPVANTHLVHEDHCDQIEWLDEMTIVSKARVGRNGKDLGWRGGNCAEVMVWRFDIIKEIIWDQLGEGLGTGIIAFPGHEGAFKLLKRFVIPRQGFWGPTMAFDGRSKIIAPMASGIWQADVLDAPAYFGVKSRPPRDLCPEVDGQPGVVQWDQMARAAPVVGSKVQMVACGLSSAGDAVVASAENGMLLVFVKLWATEVANKPK